MRIKHGFLKELFMLTLIALCTANVFSQEMAVESTIMHKYKRDQQGLYEWNGSFVYDQGTMLSPKEHRELKSFLQNLYDTTGIQFAVMTVYILDGKPNVHEYAEQHFKKWKMDQNGDKNVILVVASNAISEVEVITSDGAKDILTKKLCNKIFSKVYDNAFIDKHRGEGITNTVKNMVGILTNDDSLVTIKK
ncbi:MAG: TPM domain-containing protein [Treponema sp.]|nr:TPM domain-containing protein [Treponema sp.]